MIYACYRIIQKENGVLIPGNSNLEQAVIRYENKPDGFVEMVNEFLKDRTDERIKRFVQALRDWMCFTEPDDFSPVLSAYVRYYELWWNEEYSPFVNEW